LFKRRQVIPFSSVQRVVVDYKPYQSETGGSDSWLVSFDTGKKKIEIDRDRRYENMIALGRGISNFIETKFEIGDTKPGAPAKTLDKDKLPSKW
jgi:hypothetical protein